MGSLYTVKIDLGKVGNTLPSNCCIMDLETKKVRMKESYYMDNGEPLNNLWIPTMIGFCFVEDERLKLSVDYDWDGDIDWTYSMIEKSNDGFSKMIYIATREFDEMICKGRFTNARRAHLKKPGPWSKIPESMFEWSNVKKQIKNVNTIREHDIDSKKLMYWQGKADDIIIDTVIVHCMRDVLAVYERLGFKMSIKSKKFLRNFKYAKKEIIGEQ